VTPEEDKLLRAINIVSNTLTDHFYLLALDGFGRQKLISVGSAIVDNLIQGGLIDGVKPDDE
jgi:hypothetical protein